MADDLEARIAELEADNRRLRRMLDQRDAPAELRHRLNNTLAVLRVIVRKSAAGRRDLERYVGHLEDRLTALGRTQAAIDSWGVVDLHNLLVDELHQYGASEDERLKVEGPPIQFQPRAGQIMALAVHELAVNAVEHGPLGAGIGRIEVHWSVSGEAGAVPMLSLVWEEHGATNVVHPTERGFGTEVLTDLLRYELKAETELQFGKEGARCTIRIPLTPQIGSVGA